MLDINLTGPWHTVRVAIPTMIEQGQGGAIVFTGSVDALKGSANIASYAAAKHGITGLMRSLANEVGQYGIRVNSINPGHVDTIMLGNEFVWGLFRPDLDKPTKHDVVESFRGTNLLPEPWMQPEDVSNAILYLVSDEGRFATGTTQLLDTGFLAKS
jgi:NAD(P)-dependent dehydrogenase (short-subunit alcohol dehydrogenase family)